jgi:diketogulonate reductase-like aldo/keto reductase
MVPTKRLNNGVEIPVLGLGTYLTGRGKQTQQIIEYALEIGYRHIDTAKLYGNERDIGEAIRNSSIPREEIFVTTKLYNNDHGYDMALAAFNQSARRLGLDYVDLYLIHWPVEDIRLESWRALEKLLEEERVRAIGVSNYMPRHIKEVLKNSSITPAVNQIEFSPYLYQKDLLELCTSNSIAIEAYSPLTKGRRLGDPTLKEIGDKYGKSPAQVLIRWAIQHDLIVIPKSSNPQRIRENSKVFDFELSGDDMKILNGLDEGLRTSWDPTDVF